MAKVTHYMEARMRGFSFSTEQFLCEIKPGSKGDDWTWNDEFQKLTFDPVHAEWTAGLIRDMEANGQKEPVIIGDDGRLWDGHHRVVAAIHLGYKFILCAFRVHEGAEESVW